VISINQRILYITLYKRNF